MGDPPKPRILLVEDQEDDLALLHRSLGQTDFQILEATSAEEGMHILQVGKGVQWDVVVADYHLPGMSGIELLERVGFLMPDTNRILVTADLDFERRSRPPGSPHLTVLIKPIKLLEFNQMVHQLASMAGRARRIRERATRTTDPALRAIDPKKGPKR